MAEEYLDTDNQPYPVCPWCGEEIDPLEIEMGFTELMRDEKHPTINLRCPHCQQQLEITANFVYSTYKSDEYMEEEITEDLTNDLYEEDFEE
jgi:hypothetical protein